jgi:hypothetical protein
MANRKPIVKVILKGKPGKEFRAPARAWNTIMHIKKTFQVEDIVKDDARREMTLQWATKQCVVTVPLAQWVLIEDEGDRKTWEFVDDPDWTLVLDHQGLEQCKKFITGNVTGYRLEMEQ